MDAFDFDFASRRPSLRRLVAAIWASIAGHVLVLASHGDGIAHGFRTAEGHVASGAPASLRVRLSPVKVVTPHADSIRMRMSTASAAAPVMATDGDATGGWGHHDAPVIEPESKAALGAPVPAYYLEEELTKRPELLRDVDPDPPSLRLLSGSGRLIMDIFINEAGTVDRIARDVTDLDEPQTLAIVAEFSRLSFRPGEIDGRAVKTRMRIEATLRPIMLP